MIYYTGDIHGDASGIKRFCKRMRPAATDTVVLLGDVGVNYSLGKRVTARVAAGAERSDATRAPALGKEEAYSLDVGGAYKLTRNIALTGGVRYRIDEERTPALKDNRRDSQAVYVGTAFKF